MKTSVDIDDSKLELIRKMAATPRTKDEIIDMALEELLNSMRRQRLVGMRGTGWDGDMDEMRTYDVPRHNDCDFDQIEAHTDLKIWKGDQA